MADNMEQQTGNRKNRNLLILGLSMKTYDLEETTYQVPDPNEAPIVTGGYQLEPVPQYLAATVGLDRVLMIETEKTRDIEEYFKNRLLALDNMADQLTIDEYRLADPDKATLQDVDKIVHQIQTYVNENEMVTIYLDLHGGPRNNTEIMTTIFSLLPMEQLTNGRSIHIDPANIYSVIYNRHNQADNRIIKAGEGYQLMDLVAGVHEFVEYGRTESLNRYARHHEDIVPMVKAMDAISDALAMANIEAFDQGLKALKQEIKRKKKERYNDTDKSENTTDILIRLVDQEYGRIIWSDNKQLDKIRWCKDKKFYQLAITMCESLVPVYLKNAGLFDCSKAIGNGFGQMWRMKSQDEKFIGAFNFWVTNYQKPIKSHGMVYYRMKWAGKEPADNRFYYLECSEDVNDPVDTFLELHCNIKETRNAANHLLSFDDESVKSGRTVTRYSTTQELDDAIEQYLEAVKELRNLAKEQGLRLELKVSDSPVW